MSSRVTSDNIDIKTALFQYVNPRGKIYSILDNGLFRPNVVRPFKLSLNPPDGSPDGASS